MSIVYFRVSLSLSVHTNMHFEWPFDAPLLFQQSLSLLRLERSCTHPEMINTLQLFLRVVLPL